eukprot:m.15143 g.15143  ORF g.15143 m.15143 type:complete len:382 (+) comp4966_c1_seq1:398-1543(+)
MLWVVPLLAAATVWSFSEVLSDECVVDADDEEEEVQPLGSHAGTGLCWSVASSTGAKLNGEQATVLCALAMVPCVLTLHFSTPHEIWDVPSAAWWMCVVGGSLWAVASLCLFKAFETAPSTVLIPLTQLTAVMVLVPSTAVGLVSRFYPSITYLYVETGAFLTFRETVAYVMLFIGGMLPATKGKLSEFSKLSFWFQPHVLYITVHNFCFAFIDEILELVTGPVHGLLPDQYTLISSAGSLMTFCCVFAFVPRLRKQAVRLPSQVGRQFALMGFVAEVLNWTAFWLASYAYQYHLGNVSIVTATEVALGQLVNLVVAVWLRMQFGLGRSDAVADLPTKALSFLLVCSGVVVAILPVPVPTTTAHLALPAEVALPNFTQTQL